MGRLSTKPALRLPLFVLLLAMSAPAGSLAERPGGHDRGSRHHAPVYQRRAFEWRHPHKNWHGRGQHHEAILVPPRVSEGWFQRPYPYHLDYYRMRYGGSYAPYFGNLYGPPQVVTALPYYGPYHGDYGFANGANYAAGYMHSDQPASASNLDQEGDSSPAQNGLPAPMQP